MATPPRLPPTAWAASLDFLPYKDVRSNLRISRMFAKEVPGHVETISILRPCEMDVPAARRFSKAKRIKILCVVKETDDNGDAISLNDEAMGRAISFLQVFPQIVYLFLGGRNGPVCFRFNVIMGRGVMHADIHAEARSSYRKFMEYLCDAFKSRAVAHEHLHNIEFLSQYAHLCNRKPTINRADEGYQISYDRYDCRFCKDAMKFFPLPIALTFESLCTSLDNRFDIISSRTGGKEYLQSPSTLKYLLLAFFQVGRCPPRIQGGVERTAAKLGFEPPSEDDIKLVSIYHFNLFKLLIAFGNDPRKVDMDEVVQQWIAKTDGVCAVIPSQYLSILRELGFELPIMPVRWGSKYFHILKEGSDPDLDHLIRNMYI